MGNIYIANEDIRFGKQDWLFVDKDNIINTNYLGALVTQIDEVLLEIGILCTFQPLEKNFSFSSISKP